MYCWVLFFNDWSGVIRDYVFVFAFARSCSPGLEVPREPDHPLAHSSHGERAEDAPPSVLAEEGCCRKNWCVLIHLIMLSQVTTDFLCVSFVCERACSWRQEQWRAVVSLIFKWALANVSITFPTRNSFLWFTIKSRTWFNSKQAAFFIVWAHTHFEEVYILSFNALRRHLKRSILQDVTLGVNEPSGCHQTLVHVMFLLFPDLYGQSWRIWTERDDRLGSHRLTDANQCQCKWEVVTWWWVCCSVLYHPGLLSAL